MTQVINITEAKGKWDEILNKVFRKEDRVVVEKSGVPVGAIIPANDLERLNRLDAQRQDAFSILEEMGAAFKDVPVEEIERETAKALAEVRLDRAKKLKNK